MTASPAGVAPPVTAPFAVDDVPWEEWSEGPAFGSRVRRLSRTGGASRVGVIMEELSPGMQSCPLHYHLYEEEQMWVLEGHATLRLGDRRYALKPGDYVCFPAGQPAGHALINDSDAPFRFLMIGEQLPHDVVVYPDSDKVLVCATDEIYRKSVTVEYWDGEPPAANSPISAT